MNFHHLNELGYSDFLIEYFGDIEMEYKDIKELFITIINPTYAILTYKIAPFNYNQIITSIRNTIISYGKNPDLILYLKTFEIYTLQTFESTQNTKPYKLQFPNILDLTGKDILIGILGTGIDYLNQELIKFNGESKIEIIWDQTIDSNSIVNPSIPYGTLYTNSEINNAIKLSTTGGDPYTIVPSKDTLGVTTSMASIIASSGNNPDVKGIAPNSKLCIVKLEESNSLKEILGITIPAYNITSIFTALEFLKNYSITNLRPMIILLPLNSTLTDHNGLGILDSYISSILNNIGITLITGAGENALSDGHSTGIIPNQSTVDEVGLVISEDEKIIYFDIWMDIPNIVTINIISPSGGETGFIPIRINTYNNYKFIVDNSTTYIFTQIPDEFSGSQLIRIFIDNAKPGTWKIKLSLLKGRNAVYNIWLPQDGIKRKNTKFIPSNPYGTLSTPGDSETAITVGAYNQNNRSILNYSGNAFRNDPGSALDIVAPGVNLLTVGLNNELVTVNGTGYSAAIVAGISALLFEWGIIRGNFRNMYSPTLKTLITRGTLKRKGDTYPNSQWGYGIIDLYNIFELMS